MFIRTARRARMLNLFQSAASSTDDHMRHKEIIATRLYIILFAVCFLGAFLATALPSQKITVVIHNPSLTDYERLRIEQKSLVCSCSRITIPYSAFLSLSPPTLHQVCYSPFVSEQWISAIFGDTTANRSIAQAFLSSHFRLLAAFCLSSKQTLADALNNLGATELIGVTLLSRTELTEQMNFTVSQFYLQAPNLFRRALRFILNVTLGNQDMSAYESNWYLTPGVLPSVAMKPRYYGTYHLDASKSEGAELLLHTCPFDNIQF